MVEAKAGGGRHGSEEESVGSLFRMSENSLNLCLVGAAAGGLALGWHIRHHGVSGRLLQLMDFPGELYMRMLECLAMPVVTSSIVAGLGSVDILLAGHFGLLAMLYFVLATVMASSIGIGVALVLGPQREPCWRRQRLTHVDGFLDLLRNLVPDNCFAACVHTTVTIGTNSTDEEPFKVVSESRANVLGLLSMSVMLGAVLSVTVSESDALLNLFVGLSNATVTVSHLTAWFSPVGVFFLVATRLTQLHDMDRAYGAARSFFHVILAGLAAYGLGLLPALYMLATRQDPRGFLRFTLAPATKAFRSASRTVSVPDTIEALEDLAGLEPRIVRFVIPVGANVSMSGTALVAAATAVILARLDGLEVGLEELLIIGITVVLASLGAASIPNSGVLTVIMILMALQVSSRDISLVFALDCIFDRFRTTVNIFSDSVGSAIVQQFSSLEALEDSLDESLDEPAPIQRPKPPPITSSEISPAAQSKGEPRFETSEEEREPLETSNHQPRPPKQRSGRRTSQSLAGRKHQRHTTSPREAASVASTSSAAPSMTPTSALGAPPTDSSSVEAAMHHRAGVTPPASRGRKGEARGTAAGASSSVSEAGEAPSTDHGQHRQRQLSETAPVPTTIAGAGAVGEMGVPGQSPRRRRRHKSPRSPKAKKQSSPAGRRRKPKSTKAPLLAETPPDAAGPAV